MPDKIDGILQKLKPFEDSLLSENFSEDEYKEMLFTAGISERDYLVLKNNLQAYLNRSDGFIRQQLYDEALAELSVARLISPLNLNVNVGLSKTYLGLYLKKNIQEYLIAAEKFAHLSLRLDSTNLDAVSIIKKLKNKRSNKRNSLISKTINYVVSLFGGREKTKLAINDNSSLSSIDKFSKKELVKTEEIPKIILVPIKENFKSIFLKADIRHSQLINYNSNSHKGFTYKLQGFIISEYALKRLVLNYEALDNENKILFSGEIHTRLAQEGSKPGDMIPISAIFNNKENITTIDSVCLKIKTKEQIPALLHYPSPKTIEPIISFPETSPITSVKIFERNSKIGYNQFSKVDLHSLSIEIENTGDTIINRIDSIVHWFNASNEEISNSKWSIFYEYQTALRPGDLVCFNTVLNLKTDKAEVQYYTIEITKVISALNNPENES
jgi:tetratricopeptide (TPR) repeat protein